ncbi:protein TIC 21, chloroplastic-like [Selaginella moellendorffii]|uniref:protein TIC 21, chloroplastic-like n=1 Tax=Selaginella moellendorffii TaxID=88036 RepID=UPI000D1C630D|nr:protein TIC 21, chloroplastic-like [Selaginella moellendorffii]|eukprot:XP_024538092.1 protein TIC 21, chloroplastic-like [Selaginella moellendorffii]
MLLLHPSHCGSLLLVSNSSLKSLRQHRFLGSHPRVVFATARASYAANSPPPAAEDPSKAEKLAQVSKRLEVTGRYFKRLGNLGFWSQLACIVVSAGITAFSVLITGNATSPTTFYLTVAGIAAGFVSVFWSFGFIRLGTKLQSVDPEQAPPRIEVVENIKNGVGINLLGMGATILGMQATVGVLVAKALTSSAAPVLQRPSPSYSPVLALDVFLVQASANALLSHFLGLLFSLELLRSVTLSQNAPPPKPA